MFVKLEGADDWDEYADSAIAAAPGAGNGAISAGTNRETPPGPMGCRDYTEFDAWKLAQAFKREVFRLLRASREASLDVRFRSQLVESARGPSKHIAEGFLRKSPGVFAHYLDYAASSLGEAREHLQDGIELEYFHPDDCQFALELGRRAMAACIKLKHAQPCYREATRAPGDDEAAGPK